MLDIVATCIVLHKLCIVNKDCIEEDWIVEAENKLSRRIDEGGIRECSELRGKMVGIVEVKRRMLATEDAPIADEENDEETKKYIKKNKKANDLLREATVLHELLAESLWQYKLRKKSNILDSDSDSEIE
jgi:hypothetical protein